MSGDLSRSQRSHFHPPPYWGYTMVNMECYVDTGFQQGLGATFSDIFRQFSHIFRFDTDTFRPNSLRSYLWKNRWSWAGVRAQVFELLVNIVYNNRTRTPNNAKKTSWMQQEITINSKLLKFCPFLERPVEGKTWNRLKIFTVWKLNFWHWFSCLSYDQDFTLSQASMWRLGAVMLLIRHNS